MHTKGQLDAYPVLGPEDVFFVRVNKTETCWLWTGTKNGYGYGIFLLPGEVPVRAHRYSYERAKGPIPEGLIVMHSCDNPLCVNPDHLSVGTRGDNARDCSAKGRRPTGMKHWNAKLTPEDIQDILTSKQTNAWLAQQLGVSASHISHIRHGRHRKVG